MLQCSPFQHIVETFHFGLAQGCQGVADLIVKLINILATPAVSGETQAAGGGEKDGAGISQPDIAKTGWNDLCAVSQVRLGRIHCLFAVSQYGAASASR